MSAPCARLWQAEAATDGRLTGSELGSFERHLAVCGECRAEAESLRSFQERMRAVVAATPLSPFQQRRQRQELLRRADELLTGRSSKPRSNWTNLAMGSALVGGAALVAFQLHDGPTARPPARQTGQVTSSSAPLGSPAPSTQHEVSHTHSGLPFVHGAASPDRATPASTQRTNTGESAPGLLQAGMERAGTHCNSLDQAPTEPARAQARPEAAPSSRSPGKASASNNRGAKRQAPKGRSAQPDLAQSDLARPDLERRSGLAPVDGAEARPPRRHAQLAQITTARTPSSSERPSSAEQLATSTPSPASTTRASMGSAALPGAEAELQVSRQGGELFGLAMRTFSQGKLVEAERLLQLFAKHFPRDPRAEDAAFLAAVARQRLGDPKGAARAAESYLEAYPRGFRAGEAKAILTSYH